MKTKRMFCVALAVALSALSAAPELMAQKGQEPVPGDVPGEKSPFLAGVLSGVVFPGVGSFYAGNSGHGIRHVLIAGVGLGGLIASEDDCDWLFGSEDDSCGLMYASFVVYAGNWIWSIVAAVNDTHEYNRSLTTAGLELAPRLVILETRGDPRVGLELGRIAF